jgi:hypothetical protein
MSRAAILCFILWEVLGGLDGSAEGEASGGGRRRGGRAERGMLETGAYWCGVLSSPSKEKAIARSEVLET